jgi:putative transposase
MAFKNRRPSIDREVSKLIRQMNAANPLWGAPRIHGELLKLGFEVSQATAIDMFVVVSTSFRLLYVMIILTHAFPWDTAPRYLLRDRDAS